VPWNQLPAAPALLAGYILIMTGLFAVAASTLWWTLHAWRTPATISTTGFPGHELGARRSFSLIVPARHEEQVLEDTLERLMHLDYPAFEVVAVVGHDDPGTAAAASRVAARWPHRLRIVVDHHPVKNKPLALNTALPSCRGDIVGVFDAEDEVDERLLGQVDAAFATAGADVVQGGVQLMNLRSSWFSVRNCLEYFFWFRSRLHLHAHHRFIPLGGNTVFVRRDLLQAVGGWDPTCLAEDCELGVRLSALGATVAVAYDPELVTREETPDRVRSLVRQRTRWNQGYLQVLRKGDWRGLPWRRRWLARYTLAMPFAQAAAGVAIPISFVTMLWLKVPIGLALLSFLPVLPTLGTLAFELAGLREFCRLYYVRARTIDYLRLVVGLVPYQLLLTTAAVRAVARELLGVRTWEKTAHVGAHRTTRMPLATAAVPRSTAA
jgi:cellulose synthase/poly-beta-1,6-N-acetylglucosamine synthase-like glycosyltransferase